MSKQTKKGGKGAVKGKIQVEMRKGGWVLVKDNPKTMKVEPFRGLAEIPQVKLKNTEE